MQRRFFDIFSFFTVSAIYIASCRRKNTSEAVCGVSLSNISQKFSVAFVIADIGIPISLAMFTAQLTEW